MSRVHTPITDAMADYVRAVSSREPDALRRQRLSTDDRPDATMQTGPEQGQFLNLLARIVGAKKALEVGVFLGYSSTWVALALPPDGKVIACDLNEEFVRRARETWREAGVEDKIDLRLGPALVTLDALIADGQAGTFDFAFIDADKDNYDGYYEHCLALVRPGGLIALDNVLWSGRVLDGRDRSADTKALRALNAKLKADDRIDLAMLAIGDGLTLARVR
jgi:predicted O-methyltransferase YrrM